MQATLQPGVRVLLSALRGTPRDGSTIQRDARSVGVQGDDLVPDGLVHEAIEIFLPLLPLLLAGSIVAPWGGGRCAWSFRMQVSEGHDAVAIGAAVE